MGKVKSILVRCGVVCCVWASYALFGLVLDAQDPRSNVVLIANITALEIQRDEIEGNKRRERKRKGEREREREREREKGRERVRQSKIDRQKERERDTLCERKREKDWVRENRQRDREIER